MKLNKRGWGLVIELIIVLLAVIMLVYAIYGLNRMGLIRNLNEALGPGIKPDLVISGKTIKYETVEQSLIEAGEEYIKNNYNNSIDSDIYIRVNHLVKNDYISTIRDSNNKECSGYVVASKMSDAIKYTPYLKCSKYESGGYNKEYDW